MATASAGRADKGSSQGRGEEKPRARPPSSCAHTQGATMSDPEIEELRDKVHCAVVLEHTPPLWKLDRKESTKLSLKYRRGKGEILIVSHGGRGWWDPTSDAKGDVFSLVVVQTLEVEPSRRQELAADQAARAAFQISGAVLFLTRSLPSLN
jgi:hypothetical protein